jgi:hypothetical protein
MNNDFRKFATGHLGMNGLALDDVVKAQQQYLNPYILEERQLNVTQMDVFSRLDDGPHHLLGNGDRRLYCQYASGSVALPRLGRQWQGHLYLCQLSRR